jgi:hypothetical protein
LIKWILTVKLQPIDVNSLEKYGFFRKCLKVFGVEQAFARIPHFEHEAQF